MNGAKPTVLATGIFCDEWGALLVSSQAFSLGYENGWTFGPWLHGLQLVLANAREDRAAIVEMARVARRWLAIARARCHVRCDEWEGVVRVFPGLQPGL